MDYPDDEWYEMLFMLTDTDIHAHKSFADPTRVEPKEIQLALTGSVLMHKFAPASVTRLDIELA